MCKTKHSSMKGNEMGKEMGPLVIGTGSTAAVSY